MLDILNLTLPFFAVVGLGFFAAKRGFLPVEAVGPITTFAFYFAMPALVAGALARQDIKAILDFELLSGWLLAAIVLFIVGMIFAKINQASRGEKATLGQMALSGQAASVANVGFLSLPIAAANIGDEGVRLSASVLIVDLLVIIPFSITLLEARSEGSALRTFIRALSRAIRNPFAIAIILGVFLSATGSGLPGPTDRFATFLGNAGAPAALFALGLSLASREVEGDGTYIAIISLLKLVLHPIIVVICLWLVGAPQNIIAIAAVIAAAPVAQNVFVISSQYQVFAKRMSASVLVSTVLAVATMTAVVALVN